MLEGLTPPDPISRAAHQIPQDAVLFFSAANFYKILPELSEEWFRIMAQVPNSYLMLMPFNPNWASEYPLVSFNERLREQAAAAGVGLDRIRLHPPVPTIAHLHRIIELADVYLDSFPFSGATSMFDVLKAGVPVVARAGSVCRSRHSAAILQEAGLGDWVVSGSSHYVSRAVEWGRDGAKRAAQRERAAGVAQSGLKLADTAHIAPILMAAFDGMVSGWHRHVGALRALDAGAMAQRISASVSRIAARLAPISDHDLLVGVVLPYLRHGGSRRLIDVGACLGSMTRPLLDEGWQAVMFEPDERCHPTLGALVDAYPGQLRLQKSAVTAGRDGTTTFHLAGSVGLSGLSHSPYAPDLMTVDVGAAGLARYIARNGLFDVDFIKIDAEGHDLAILESLDFGAVAPRMIMVEFGDQFAAQDRAAVEAALHDMRPKGYRACVVCARPLGRFDRQEWQTSLLAIGIDAVPSLPDGLPLMGNILFFRRDDADFLPSLCDWLDQSGHWKGSDLPPAA
jgi:FkbM family methyltransferase